MTWTGMTWSIGLIWLGANLVLAIWIAVLFVRRHHEEDKAVMVADALDDKRIAEILSEVMTRPLQQPGIDDGDRRKGVE